MKSRPPSLLVLGISLLLGLVASVRAEVRSVGSVPELRMLAGKDGEVCVVAGYAQPGDGGGGMFAWRPALTVAEDDGGTRLAGTGGGWQRVEGAPLRAAWFGAFPVTGEAEATAEQAEAATAGLERALKAAAGQTLILDKGIYPVSRTLVILPGTTVTGQGAFDQWSRLEMGTTLSTFGPGVVKRWSDSGATDDLTPLLVAGGNNVVVERLGLVTARGQGDRWDVGILFPATKRCSLEYINARGWWKLAAVLVDASWSEKNTALTALHPEIQTSSINEFLMYRCYVEGRWGLMVRGSLTKDPRTTEGEWIHSPGGTSDLDVIACRLGTDGPKKELAEDGGAYYHSAPMTNAAKAGQEHRFFGCSFRVSSKYAIYLDYSNRDKFFGCYAETVHHNEIGPAMIANTKNTGGVLFAGCRWNMKFDESCWDFSKTQIVGDVNYSIPGGGKRGMTGPEGE